MHPKMLSGCKPNTVKKKTQCIEHTSLHFAFGSYLISYSLVLIVGWRFYSASACLEGNNLNNAFLSSIHVILMKIFPRKLSSGKLLQFAHYLFPFSHISLSLIWIVWLI